jgi:hypothetical protein
MREPRPRPKAEGPWNAAGASLCSKVEEFGILYPQMIAAEKNSPGEGLSTGPDFPLFHLFIPPESQACGMVLPRFRESLLHSVH